MDNDYNTFLLEAKQIFELSKREELFDMNQKKLVKSNFPHGLFLAMKIDGEFIGVKIMVGTQDQIKEAFKDG